MQATFLGLTLLVWFSGATDAQGSERACQTPQLSNGFLVPDQDVYTHGSQLVYSCDPGYKPAEEGWWQTITCRGGKWSHQPQCIDEKSCFPPVITNGKYDETEQRWFPNRAYLKTTCEPGFSHRSGSHAFCYNGFWSSVPICDKKAYACDEPPTQPHAVVVNHRYQEVYEVDTQLNYECEEGYAFEGASPRKSTVCRYGQWTIMDQCVKKSAPIPTASTSGSGRQPGGASSGGQVDSEEVESMTSISRCGKIPVIPNGEVVLKTRSYIRYQCASYYTFEGSDVYCLDSGSWSKLPSCKANFCLVDTDQNPRLANAGRVYLKHKEKRRLVCTYGNVWNDYAEARCVDGVLRVGNCCSWTSLNVGTC